MLRAWNDAYRASVDELHRAIQQSWCTVSAYEADRLVGFGRVVSDGVLYAMVYDLIAAPSHQTRGIGTEILACLVQKCKSAGIRDVQFMSSTGKPEFYTKRGFLQRPEDAPGMRLKK